MSQTEGIGVTADIHPNPAFAGWFISGSVKTSINNQPKGGVNVRANLRSNGLIQTFTLDPTVDRDTYQWKDITTDSNGNANYSFYISPFDLSINREITFTIIDQPSTFPYGIQFFTIPIFWYLLIAFLSVIIYKKISSKIFSTKK